MYPALFDLWVLNDIIYEKNQVMEKENNSTASLEDERGLEQEIDKIATAREAEIAELQRQLSDQTEQVSQQEAKLHQQAEQLFSLRLRLETEQLKKVELVLKEKISWYLPLEDILGVPIIGEKVDDFKLRVSDHEHVLACSKDTDGIYPSDEVKKIADALGDEELRLIIGSKYTKLAAAEGYAGYHAEVDVRIMPDGTLRPKVIRGYEKIFPGKPEFHLFSNIDIELVDGLSEPWQGSEQEDEKTDGYLIVNAKLYAWNCGHGLRRNAGLREHYNIFGGRTYDFISPPCNDCNAMRNLRLPEFSVWEDKQI